MEAIGTLAGGIAHDFNNILTAILGYGSLLHMEMDEMDPLMLYVDPILSAADKAGDLIRSLLAFSRQQPIALNPIHINEEFAKKTAAGGTIAHGMLNLAYVSQMLTSAFGRSWLENGRFNIRFKMPARPGDDLTIQGKIEKITPDNGTTVVSCSVSCTNQKGETVINGEAIVRLN